MSIPKLASVSHIFIRRYRSVVLVSGPTRDTQVVQKIRRPVRIAMGFASRSSRAKNPGLQTGNNGNDPTTPCETGGNFSWLRVVFLVVHMIGLIATFLAHKI